MLVGQEHPSAVRRVDVQPGTRPIRDLPQLGKGIHRSRVGAAAHGDDGHRTDPAADVLLDRRFQGIQADLEAIVGRKHPQALAPDPHRVRRLVHGDVALLGGVGRPSRCDALPLGRVAGGPIPRQLQTDEVRHHSAAGQVPARLLAQTRQIGEPPHRSPFQRHRRGADAVRPHVLVQGRCDEVGQNSHGGGGRGDEPHVARVIHLRAVRKQLLPQLQEDRRQGGGIAGHRLIEDPAEKARLHGGKQGLLLHPLQIVGQIVDDFVSRFAKFRRVHGRVLPRA